MSTQLDDARSFQELTAPYLVLDRDLVVVEANAAYLRLVGARAGELVGRPVFGALPPRPESLGEDGVPRLRRSFEQVLATGRPDVLHAERSTVIDLRDGGAGPDRRWSSITVPVLDGEGRVELLVHRVEELAPPATGVRRRPPTTDVRWRTRALVAETELVARAHEVAAAREADRRRARELAALADAAVLIATAQDVDELVGVVLGRALPALGAQAGGIALREGDVLHLTTTGVAGDPPGPHRSTVPLDSAVPVAVSSATGRVVVLTDPAPGATPADGVDGGDGGAPECRAWVALPLPDPTAGGAGALGSLLLGWADPRASTPAGLEVLEVVASRCAQALARLRTRQDERTRARETSDLAEALQRVLLSEPARPDGLDVATRYRPAAERVQVGGDWYDSFVTAGGRTTLVVGDVCGHDHEAAAAMGQVRNLLRGLAYTVGHPPSAVLTLLDRALAGLEVGTLATVVVVTVEQDEELRAAGVHRICWSNAGHPPPVLVHPDGRAELLDAGAELLLGLEAESPRSDHRVEIATGSTLLLFTDGLVERRGTDLDVGLEWLRDSAGRLARLGPDDFCDALLQQVRDTAEDDVVVLALRV